MNRGRGLPIFDDVERVLDDGRLLAEPQFAYLNRSGRPEAAEVRDFLEGCLDRYPAANREQMRSLIRLEDRYEAAVFELLVHEWCLRAGMEILEVEPAVPETLHRPDFLVAAADGRTFYLEATVSTGTTRAEAGRRRIVAAVIEAVQRLELPDFLLDIRTRGSPDAQFSRRRFLGEVRRWLDGLDHAEVMATLDRGNPPPTRVFQLKGLSLIATAISRGSSRGDRTGALGSFGGVHAEEVTIEKSVRDFSSTRPCITVDQACRSSSRSTSLGLRRGPSIRLTHCSAPR